MLVNYLGTGVGLQEGLTHTKCFIDHTEVMCSARFMLCTRSEAKRAEHALHRVTFFCYITKIEQISFSVNTFVVYLLKD